jgi:hypothetical protein
MEPRTFVTFEWAEPDEEKVGPDEEVTPAGGAIMRALRAAMLERGFSPTPVEQHDSYGWYFDTRIGDTTVWSMLQQSDTWLLISEAPVGLLQRLRGRNNAAALTECTHALHTCLSALPLASRMQWFTREEFTRSKGTGGANAP